MLNSPITGDENLDAFLFDLQTQATAPTGVAIDPSTGHVYDTSTGAILSYMYKYIHIKYAADNIGTGMSTTDTGQNYFGIWNSDSLTPSTNPASYTWYVASFGASNHLYYIVSGGRQIRWSVGTSAPSGYTLDTTHIVDLDAVSAAAGGSAGLNSIMAYKVQSQSAAAPTFTATTVGNAVPAGWSGSIGTVAVGNVAWYIFGRYNSTAGVVDGVAANSTSWTGPIAASVFQDIMSDNYNGSVPPTFSNPATWGTTGYYLKRSDGTLIANNLGARGTIQAGTAAVSGSTMTGSGGVINNNGTFALGNSTNNVSFDGATLTVNGPVVTTGNIVANAVSDVQAFTQSISALYAGSSALVATFNLTTANYPCVLQFDTHGQQIWFNGSNIGNADLYLCAGTVTCQLYQPATGVNKYYSQTGLIGGPNAYTYTGLSFSALFPNPSAGVIYVYLTLSFVGAAPAAWPGTPSACHSMQFSNGNATVIGMKR